MKKCLLFLTCLLFLLKSYSQATFISIEQAKYHKGESLTYAGGSHYYVEISMQVRAGYILVKNKDTGFENYYTNVVPGPVSNTWRGYSKSTKQACLFHILTVKNQVCIAADDDVMVTFFKVQTAKPNPAKNQRKQ